MLRNRKRTPYQRFRLRQWRTVSGPEQGEAVRMVAAGESLLFPASTRRVIERFARAGASGSLPDLTDREQDILRCLARGLSNQEIATELFVTVETVKSHVASVLMKLGVRDRTQAVIAAYETGFVQPGEA